MSQAPRPSAANRAGELTLESVHFISSLVVESLERFELFAQRVRGLHACALPVSVAQGPERGRAACAEASCTERGVTCDAKKHNRKKLGKKGGLVPVTRSTATCDGGILAFRISLVSRLFPVRFGRSNSVLKSHWLCESCEISIVLVRYRRWTLGNRTGDAQYRDVRAEHLRERAFRVAVDADLRFRAAGNSETREYVARPFLLLL